MTTPEIRLACQYCDTDEADGVTEIPSGWLDVCFVQDLAASYQEAPLDDPSRSPLEWYTHLGICPACRKFYE